MECFVDEDGNYTRDLGPKLYGKSVLDGGSKLVLDIYKKHVIHTHEHTHSYPYDWRTKKVCFSRTCQYLNLFTFIFSRSLSEVLCNGLLMF